MKCEIAHPRYISFLVLKNLSIRKTMFGVPSTSKNKYVVTKDTAHTNGAINIKKILNVPSQNIPQKTKFIIKKGIKPNFIFKVMALGNLSVIFPLCLMHKTRLTNPRTKTTPIIPKQAKSMP